MTPLDIRDPESTNISDTSSAMVHADSAKTPKGGDVNLRQTVLSNLQIRHKTEIIGGSKWPIADNVGCENQLHQIP